MDLLNALGEFLTKFGGWGAFLLLSYAFRGYYLDQQKRDERQEAKDAETFKLVVKMTSEMSSVLAQNTAETRALADNLEQMQALLTPVTKQDKHQVAGGRAYPGAKKSLAAPRTDDGDAT